VRSDRTCGARRAWHDVLAGGFEFDLHGAGRRASLSASRHAGLRRIGPSSQSRIHPEEWPDTSRFMIRSALHGKRRPRVPDGQRRGCILVPPTSRGQICPCPAFNILLIGGSAKETGEPEVRLHTRSPNLRARPRLTVTALLCEPRQVAELGTSSGCNEGSKIRAIRGFRCG
jgi:hypothetical protein